MKKILAFSLIFGVVLLSGCSCSVKKDDNNDDKNTDQKSTVITDKNVIGEQNINGVLFENTTFEIKDGVTTIVTKITNNTGADFNLDNYQMVITDKNGTVLTILTSTVGEVLTQGQEKIYTTPFELDLSTAANVDYRINVVITE